MNTLREALDDPNLHAQGLILTDDRGREHIAPVVRFTLEPARPSLREPTLDEHHSVVGGN